MSGYNELKNAIRRVVKTNNNREITGQNLQSTLTSMVNSLGANYHFAGFASPDTNPGTPDQNIFYIASEEGTYVNFDGINLEPGLSFLMWNGKWSSETISVGEVTKSWVQQNYVSIAFFNELFELYNDSTKIAVNDTIPVDKDKLNIKAMFGFWTEQYISALGKNDSGGSGSSVDMATVWSALAGSTDEQINKSHLTTALSEYATQSWVSQIFATITSIPTKLSQLANDTGFITSAALPTKVSQLVNDAGYVTASIVNGYATQSWVSQNFATITSIPTKLSQLANDTGFITSAALPTKVSQLTNDTGFITSAALPTKVSQLVNDAGYVTASIVNGYATQSWVSQNFATITSIPTKLSQLANDTGFITSAALPTKVSQLTNDTGFITSAALPTKVSQLVNDAGYVTASIVNGYATQSWVSQNYVSVEFFERLFQAYSGTTKVDTNSTSAIDNIKAMFGFWTEQYISALGKNTSGGGDIDMTTVWSAMANNTNEQINLSHLTTALSGYATQSWVQQQLTGGTVTAVKVGTTIYSPTDGVVSLPAYPTTLPASDVYSWAKASTKPSYTLDEVSDGSTRKLSDYLPLSGGTLTGDITVRHVHVNDTDGSDSITFVRGNYSYLRAKTTGGKIGFITDGKVMLGNSVDFAIGNGWASVNNGVYGASGYNLYVNGSSNATILYENGSRVITSGNIGSQSVNYATSSGSCSGNAASATKLQTTRTIWGHSFDGSANITGNLSSVGNISFSASGKSIGSLLYFDITNSRIGIGIASPSSMLHLYTDTSETKLLLQSDGIGGDQGGFYVLRGTGGGLTSFIENRDFIWRKGSGSITGGGGTELMRLTNSGSLNLLCSNQFNYVGNNNGIEGLAINYDSYNHAGQDIRFFDGKYSEKVRIKSDGKVGIGTISPTSLLHAIGDARFDGRLLLNPTTENMISSYNTSLGTNGFATILFGKTNSTGNAAQLIYAHTGSNSANNAFYFGFYNNYQLFTILNGGNVGIGNANPSYKLHVGGYVALHEGLVFTRENWNYICVPATNGILSFNVGVAGTANTKMCVANSGNVGIGTTSPSYKLHVAGVIYSTTGIFSDGNVGIGTTTPTHKLHVIGDMATTGRAIVDSLQIGSITISYDAANKGLRIAGGGLYTDSYLSSLGVNASTALSVKKWADSINLTEESDAELATAYSIGNLYRMINSNQKTITESLNQSVVTLQGRCTSLEQRVSALEKKVN